MPDAPRRGVLASVVVAGSRSVFADGDVVHIRGPSGSGKTTLLRTLAGLSGPGMARILGDDPAALPAASLASRLAFVQAPARRGLVGLTVAGEARLCRQGLPRRVAPLADRPIASLSDGEAAHLACTLAIHREVPILLLDEPAASLDDEALPWLGQAIQRRRAGGKLTVFTDPTQRLAHLANRVLDVATGDQATETTATIPSHPGPAVPGIAAPAVLVAPACWADRGGRRIGLPGLRLGPGMHVVVGRNGAGKSTLLRRLAGLQDAGGVLVDRRPVVPGQTARMLLPDHGRLLTSMSVAGEFTSDPHGFVPAALFHRHPLSLSSGEAQRVALAKAFARDAPVLLLDEPEAHLDASGRARLETALATERRDRCIVVATHDPRLIQAADTRVELTL